MNQIIFGDCIETMKDLISKGVKVQTCVTSPPYFGLRDYGVDNQIGLEETPQAYVDKMVEVFRCVKDLLADDGTLWLNLGDSYFSTTKGSGGSNPENSPFQNRKGKNNFQGFESRKFSAGNTSCKPKDLIGIPWRVALALQADGWYLRQDIIWAKPNPMPESVTDRCTKSHEYIFLMSKNPKYYFDHEAIKEPSINPESYKGRKKRSSMTEQSEILMGRFGETRKGFNNIKEGKTYTTKNKRSVWTQTVKPYKGAHFATFPTQLIEPCVLAGSRIDDIVFDPFMGSGTTAQVAIENGRQYLGCELNPEYKKLQDERIAKAYGVKKTPLPMG